MGVLFSNMKRTPLAVAVIAAALILAPTVAHADDPPSPITWDDYRPGVIDCNTATIDLATVHYQADWVGPGPYDYTAWYQVGPVEHFIAGATVEDCPNWHPDGNGGWTHTAVPVKPKPPAPPPVVVMPATVKPAPAATVKVGLAVAPKVLA